jgi:hypothetical protein
MAVDGDPGSRVAMCKTGQSGALFGRPARAAACANHGPPKPTWRLPSGKERLSAIGLFADKILPSLRSQEMTGKDGAPLLPATPPNIREMAKSILAVLSEAVPGGSGIAITPPGEHVARFRDKALGERILPNDTDDEGDAGPAHRAYPTPEATATPVPDAPAKPGDFVLAADGAAGILMLPMLPDGREQWGIYRTNNHSIPTTGSWTPLERHHTSKAAAIRRVAELVERGTFGRPANVRNEPEPGEYR